MKLPLLLIISSLLLTACSGLLEDDNSTPPAELIDIVQTLEIETLWQTNNRTSLDILEQGHHSQLSLESKERQLKLRPVLADKQIYVAEPNGVVNGYEAESGSRMWQVDTKAELGAGPGLGGSLVVLGSRNGEVIALDRLSGEERWRKRVSSEILATPAISDERVVVHTIDGKVYGLDMATGKQAWLYEVSIPLLTLRGSGSAVISGSLAIVGFSGGKLVALELSNGTPRWEVNISTPTGRSELDRIVDIDADPVVVDDVVYAASYQGELAAVTLDGGRVLWRTELSSYAGVAVDHDRVFLADARGHLWGIDARTGGALWKQTKLQGRKLSAPVVLGNYLLVGDFEGYMHWLSIDDGALLARKNFDSAAITMQPAVAGDIAYVFDIEGQLAAIQTGKKIAVATQMEP